MNDKEKSQTIHIPTKGTPGAPRSSANLDDVPTQVQLASAGPAIGRLTIIEGLGLGTVRSIYKGTNSVGRYTDNIVSLDFGDNAISRHQHAVIDCNDREVRILDGGKPNPIEVNGVRVVKEQVLRSGDLVQIGMTKLRYEKM
ncbi:MAG: FHA domain-containing protein [Hyphomicrobiaceae bacterium]